MARPKGKKTYSGNLCFSCGSTDTYYNTLTDIVRCETCGKRVTT